MSLDTYTLASRLGIATKEIATDEPAAIDAIDAISAIDATDEVVSIPLPDPIAAPGPEAVRLPATDEWLSITAPLPATPRPERIDRQRLNEVKARVQRALVENVAPGTELEDTALLRQMVEGFVDQAVAELGVFLTRAERVRLFESIAA